MRKRSMGAFPMPYTLAYKLAVGAFGVFDDVRNVLRRIYDVLLDGRSFAPCTDPFTATVRFFNVFVFHKSRNIIIFANEKPCGEATLPLAQKRILTTSLRSMRIVTNQTLIEIRCIIRHMVFCFTYSFQGFRHTLRNLSLAALQRYEDYLNYTNSFQRFTVKLS